MKFLELVKNRKSVRQYSDQPIESEKLEYVLESARLAPSAVNYQPWHFVVIKNEEMKQLIQQCYPAQWFKNAPVYIVACTNHQSSWKRGFDGKDHADIDISIAIEHICLAATEQNLGTCWVCNFDAQKCKQLLKLPSHISVVAIIPIGYPTTDSTRQTSRKSPDEIYTIIE